MKIRVKLVAFGAAMASGVAAISVASLLGMQNVEEQLTVLTERSTPQQLGTIELQRRLQEHAVNLLKVAAAQTPEELAAVAGNAENSATAAIALRQALEAPDHATAGGDAEPSEQLATITREAIATATARLRAEADTLAAEVTVRRLLQDATHRLDELSRSMNALAARDLLAARELELGFAQELLELTTLRDVLKDLLAAVNELHRADSRRAALIARSRIDTALRKFGQNRLVATNHVDVRSVARLIGEVKQLADGPEGLAELRNLAIAGGASDDRHRAYRNRGQEVDGRLAVAMATLTQEITLASARYVAQNRSHDASLRNSIATSDSVALNGRLISLGLALSVDTQAMLHAASVGELEETVRRVGAALGDARSVQRKLGTLARAGSPEARRIADVGALLERLDGVILAKGGINDRMHEVLAVRAQARQIGQELVAYTNLQSERGRELTASARAEQERAIRSVQELVGRHLLIVATFALSVLALGALGGSRVWRALTRPAAALIRVMGHVSRHGDYGVRAPVESNDEVGHLARGFNAMLQQIEERDRRLAQQRDELEQKVTERTAELHHAKDLAEAGSRAKSEFLATMSHEIRTPINGVLGMSDLLRATPLSAAQQRYADAVFHSGEHLLAIINDILDFSKIEAGRLELENIAFDPRELTEDVACLLAQAAEAKGVAMVCDIGQDLPPVVTGDPVRLRQVLSNLVGNAVKFTGQGEIIARVRRQGEDGQRVALRFEVEDSGIGISDEAQARLFAAFAQADSSTTRRYGGSGLGLAISKRLVEMMGGRIGVRSTLGRGTLFWFELPFPSSAGGSLPVFVPHEGLRGRRVLLIDHRATQRQVLGALLSGWSLTVVAAANEEDAWAALAREPSGGFDLLIVERQLPDVAAADLVRRIRAAGHGADLPFVAISPAGTAAGARGVMSPALGAEVARPIRRAELYAAVCQALAPEALPTAASLPAASNGERAFAGRALVAEDNPVNQELVQAMLESFGVRCCLVDNGLGALEQLAQERFDLVLMDCQMPEMDGFQATAEIRARQRQGLLPANIPVVALTANAVQGDRERCLDAGMDDYLSKPFTRADLSATLARWLRPGDAADVAVPATDIARSEGGNPTPLNRRALDAIRQVSATRGADLVDRVINAYVVDAPGQLARMRAAASTGDAPALRVAAHSVKATSATVGAERLAGLCRDLEAIARSGRLDGIADPLAAAERELPRVLAALTAELQGQAEVVPA